MGGLRGLTTDASRDGVPAALVSGGLALIAAVLVGDFIVTASLDEADTLVATGAAGLITGFTLGLAPSTARSMTLRSSSGFGYPTTTLSMKRSTCASGSG